MSNRVIVIGAGFAGSILARLFAEAGKKVAVFEKRDHIAGNMYDYMDKYNIRIQKYGPHVFHSNDEKAYQYIVRFCDLMPYRLKCEAVLDGVATPSPFNFTTVDQFYGKKMNRGGADQLKRKLISYYGRESATVLEMLRCDDKEIRQYAEFLFEKDYKPYTAKQWGLLPKNIDPVVLKRVPVVFNYNDTYFYDKYEGIPSEGYTALFKNILAHSNITLNLKTDALPYIVIDNKKEKILFDGHEDVIVFTGAIDELFGYMFGHLPYRTLNFKYEYYPQKSYQNAAIVAHPTDADYTRITEYTKLPLQDIGDRTVIAKEYSRQYDKDNPKRNEPFYPVLTTESKKIYQLYAKYAKRFSNLVLCGRLAEFKYYNMDSVIIRALQLFDGLKEQLLD